MSEKEQLLTMYNELCVTLNDDEKRSLHLNSIGNFIESYDELKQHDKQTIYNGICEYLNVLKEKSTEETSHKLFYNYVYPIGKIYEDRLNFGIKVKPWIYFSYIIIALFVLLMIKNVVLNILCLIIAVIYVNFLRKKPKGNKTYGFKW